MSSTAANRFPKMAAGGRQMLPPAGRAAEPATVAGDRATLGLPTEEEFWDAFELDDDTEPQPAYGDFWAPGDEENEAI